MGGRVGLMTEEGGCLGSVEMKAVNFQLHMIIFFF